MLIAPKNTLLINSFVYTAIPSPKDYFKRYGFRNSVGTMQTDSDSYVEPVHFSETPISQMIDASLRLQSGYEATKVAE